MQTLRQSLRLGAGAAALIGTVLLAPGVFAQSTPAKMTKGAYVFGDIGANWLRDAPSSGVNTTYNYDAGWAGVAGAGWGFGNGFRVEGEVGHRDSDVSNADGDTSATSLMANALYDFDTGTPFTPYAGVGTGAARVKFHRVGVPGSSNSIDDADTVWAYQGILGGTYQLEGNWKIDANYRYLGTEKPDLTAANGAAVSTHYRDHAVLVGLRYEFGS